MQDSGQKTMIDDAMLYASMQTSSNIENLENKNINLRQKEEENKLSFNKPNRLPNVQSTGIIEEFDETTMMS